MLLARSYKANMLTEVMETATRMDRDQTLEKVERVKQEPRVPYIVTFDPRLPAIPAILRKNWLTMLERDQSLVFLPFVVVREVLTWLIIC